MTQFPPIAIVGRACLLPGVSSADELWEAVVSGMDLVSSVPADRWGMSPDDVLCAPGATESGDRTWSDRGGYVRGFDDIFDPEGFAVPADEIRGLDPVFQWTFHTAREALRDAGYADADPERYGAVFGNLSFPSAGMAAFTQTTAIGAVSGYEDVLADADVDARNRFTSGLPALLLERSLGLGVGAFALDAACASSLYAIKLACDKLHDGNADLMLAGAVNSADDLCIHLGFTALQALSRTGRSRPFHQDADGLVPAEGSGFVALKRFDDAVRDGDTIHGIIRGIGLSNDGRGRGMLVPSEEGQTRAISRALELSGLAPTDISLLECHATGTPVGDGTEIRSTAVAYEGCSEIPIGSLKSNTGHLIATAGVAGLIKVIEAMRHETRPPTLHADTPLDALADSPFRLLQQAEPWTCDDQSDGVLRAGVSAFGFGGNNAHLIVESPGLGSGTKQVKLDAAGGEASNTNAPVADALVAIVGVGIVAASAVGRLAFADALINQTSCLDEAGIGAMPDVSLRLTEQKFPPNDLKATLAQQLVMLQVADEALADSGPLPGEATGIYVGMGTDPEAARFGVRWRAATAGSEWGCSPEWIATARDSIGPVLDAAGVLGSMPNIVANRLNSQYDIAGPSLTVSAEERSGLEAFDLAVRALRMGEIDAAMVGAVDLSCNPVHQAAVAEAIPTPDRPAGDAAVMLVLKRLDDAKRDDNKIYAILPKATLGSDPSVALGPDLRFGVGDGVGVVTPLFGHSHTASALVHVAAATMALHHRVAPGDVPLIASNLDAGTEYPPGVGPRTASVGVLAMDGLKRRSVLLAEASGHSAPSRGVAPRLHIFSGETADDVLVSLDAGTESNGGPARLVIVANSDEQFAERSGRARQHLINGHPAGVGVHFREAPVGGEMAFVFTAAGAAYQGMGADLLRALPEITNPASSNFPFGEVAGWVFEADRDLTPNDYLWGTALLSQAHAELTLRLLKLEPDAAIGYSSGESNSLYAFGIWRDMAAMRDEINASGMMDRELGVDFTAVARAWGAESAQWAMWNVLASVDEVRDAIADEERVHLAIINTNQDVVIGGDAEACERAVDAIGRRRCVAVGYNLACHVPEVAAEFHQAWVDVHTRQVTPMAGIRHYSNGLNAAYEVGEQACADAITAQAEATLDFPATIEAAYADGVRVFVEHGPAGACTNFINEILGDRDILAVRLDRKDKNIEQIFEVVAALVAAGVEVDHEALTERLTPPDLPVVDGGPTLTFPAHPAPINLPPRPGVTSNGTTPDVQSFQPMPPAPGLPSVLFPVFNGVATPAAATIALQEVPPAGSVFATIQQQLTAMTALHNGFVQQQTAIHQQFLATRNSYARGQTPIATPVSYARGQTPIATPGVTTPGVTFAPLGSTWNKQQLQIHSSGKISELFGAMFEPQDGFELQCRMPEPPLLLADRVTGLAAEVGVLGQGTMWTETDVTADAYYLNDGYMPAGFMIESGQADLMLISYMGIDLLNKGDRVYRLLGCTLTYHGDLPSVGETLQYEIRINRHASHGDIRLFFFEYDCIVDGQPRLTVRDAQAGFFTRQELEDALGVLWTPETGRADLDDDARVDAPAVACAKRSFTADEVIAFSDGRVLDCFGPGFEWTETHTRTPKIQASEQLLIDEVVAFDPTGGPWGRGFMRCEADVADDEWFFDGHFKNDPCMPGNLMVEACIQASSLYITALGYTTRRDGWRFQPLAEQPCDLKCRGEINPSTTRVAYEVHIEEVWSGPHPTIICDVVGFVDGQAAFHAHRMGVELVPDWPLSSMPELYENAVEPVAVAVSPDGLPFDWKAMIACAWGKPSDAFGSMYEMFDGVRRSPRLPGEPYHFISRVTSIVGDLDVCAEGMEIVCEYDIPDDAWYFDANGVETMPYAVLLEAALQPCGWVASAVGSVTGLDDDLLFRNLDGTGTLVDELTRSAGTLITRVKLKSVSRAGGMVIEGFDVVCSLGDREIYMMDTVFGFFPLEAFENQAGLPVSDAQRAELELAGGEPADLVERPERFCDGPGPRLAEPMLLMVDRATHITDAGAAGLGVVRGEKDVDVSEWFFKAHFFQDPVQPGSLGIEALLQLLQFYMLDSGMAEGLAAGAHFEPITLGTPLTWKYRGQVTPKNKLITTTMEVTEVGTDDEGPYVVGKGSLWCDGLRIYEVANMGMRIVPYAPKGPSGRPVIPAGEMAASDDRPASGGAASGGGVVVRDVGSSSNGPKRSAAGEVALADVKDAMRTFWQPRRGTPDGWLGDDLVEGLLDRYVNRVIVPGADTLERLHGKSAIFLANHQVQIESLLITTVLPALTGVSVTSVANAKHQSRWIGELVGLLEAYPGYTGEELIAYFDQADPAAMFEIIEGVKAKMAQGAQSFFVHTDGTRAQSCRELASKCSSVFLDLALEMDVPIVPVRFTGGLPVDPIKGKAEFPVGHGRQDYWIGEPIEATELRSPTLRDRVDRVVNAINALGVAPADEVSSVGDEEFAAKTGEWQSQTGTHKVYAAAWQILAERDDTGQDTQLLRDASVAGVYKSDGGERGDWLGQMGELFFASNGPVVNSPVLRTAIKVNRSTHPHLVDHSIDGTPVVPVVYAIEWFARAAVAHSPELHLTELSNVRVLKGIVATDFLAGGDLDLVVSAQAVSRTADATVLTLDLLDESTGRSHYRCTATLASDAPIAQTSVPALAADATPWDQPVYGEGVLFHGEKFHAIKSVDGVSDQDMTATLVGMADLDWPTESWVTDPALLDGALQLALLWTEHLTGRPSLPTSVGELRVFGLPAAGQIEATLVGQNSTNSKIACDVVFREATGSVVAELVGIETHLLSQ